MHSEIFDTIMITYIAAALSGLIVWLFAINSGSDDDGDGGCLVAVDVDAGQSDDASPFGFRGKSL